MHALFTERGLLASELAASVVAKASALLASVKTTSLNPAELLSVERTWSEMDHSTNQGQTRAAPTLALVKALTLAQDDARDTVLWPTPEEEQEERRREKKRGDSGDRGKDYHRGCGGSGGGGKGGGGGSHGGGGSPHHCRGGGDGGGGGGDTSGPGAGGGGTGRRQGGGFGRNNRGRSAQEAVPTDTAR